MDNRQHVWKVGCLAVKFAYVFILYVFTEVPVNNLLMSLGINKVISAIVPVRYITMCIAVLKNMIQYPPEVSTQRGI